MWNIYLLQSRELDTQSKILELLKYQGEKKILEDLSRWSIPRFPVSGHDLRKLGITSGKEIGTILQELRDTWKKSRYQMNKEELLATLSRSWYEATHVHYSVHNTRGIKKPSGLCLACVLSFFSDADNVIATFKTLLQIIQDAENVWFLFCQLHMKFFVFGMAMAWFVFDQYKFEYASWGLLRCQVCLMHDFALS